MNNSLDIIVKESAGLIWSVAKKFYGVEKNDLYQAGVLGVIKAYQNYQNDGNTKFSTYAYKYIYGEMYVVACNKEMKYSKDLFSLVRKLEKGKEILAQKIMRDPTVAELARFLEMDEEKIEQALLSYNNMISLDNEMDDNRSLHEVIAIDESVTTDDKLLLKEGISTLDSLEKDIIEARYFEDLTQSETARKLGITQVMVSRYEAKSLKKMRTFMYM